MGGNPLNDGCSTKERSVNALVEIQHYHKRSSNWKATLTVILALVSYEVELLRFTTGDLSATKSPILNLPHLLGYTCQVKQETVMQIQEKAEMETHF